MSYPPAGRPPKKTLRVIHVFEIDQLTGAVISKDFYVVTGTPPVVIHGPLASLQEALDWIRENAHRLDYS